jgi:hypothetical protein
VISYVSSFLQSATDGRQYSITWRHFSFPQNIVCGVAVRSYVISLEGLDRAGTLNLRVLTSLSTERSEPSLGPFS